MKFVIWGARHYGKAYFNGLFRYNRKTVTQMQIGGKYVSHKWEYHDLDQHHIKYKRYDDSDTITPVIKVDSLSSEQLLHHYTDTGIKIEYFVYEDYLGYGKNNPPKTKFKVGTWKENNRKLYPIYEDHGMTISSMIYAHVTYFYLNHIHKYSINHLQNTLEHVII